MADPDGYVTNGQVNAVGFDSTGRAYLGGTFTSVGARTGHGVKLSTTSDQPAPGFPDVDGSIRAVAPDGSGGWFIGGDFTRAGGLPRARLAHIDSLGSVDTAWNPGADGRVNAIAVTGTSVFVGGEFTTIAGQSRPFVAQLAKTDGALTTTWDASANGRVTALAASPAGLYAGGDFTQIGGQSRNRLARIGDGASATADATWDPDVDGNVAAIVVSATDVYAGGSFTHVGGEQRDRLVKLDPTTAVPDMAWHPSATGGAVAALALSGSDLYAGGAFTSVDLQPRNRLAKLDAGTGALSLGWSPSANNTVLALAATATDVYAAGDFTQIGVDTRNRLAKLAASDGSVDAWNPNANGTARTIAISGTDVFAGGDFTSVGGQARNRLARIDTDGSVDAWNPDAEGSVSALVVSGSDVYVGGAFTSIGSDARARLAKLSTSSDAADATWNPGATGTVSALAVSGTDVYAGGLFLNAGGQPRARIAKLIGASGSADPDWNPGANGQVSALTVDGSNVYAGGSFTTIDSAPRNRIARLTTSDVPVSKVDGTWDPDANGSVSALAVFGTDVYAGGSFSSIGGLDRNFIAKLTTAGAGDADPTWDPNANSVVRSIALSASDAYIGGAFTAVSDQTHGRLAKLPQSGTGTADAGWEPGANNTVLALAVQDDRLAAGGSFTAVGGQSSAGFAFFDLPALSPSPGGLAFGNRQVGAGASSPQTSVVANNGSQTVHITAVTVGGTDADQFGHPSDLGTDCVAGTDLAPASSCEVRATFNPTTPGPKSAEITIDSDSPGVSVALSGVGSQSALSPDPASIDFGSQDIDGGATTVRESTVTNDGTQTITLSTVTVGGAHAADFIRQGDDPLDCRGAGQDTAEGFSTATQLIPGQSCTVRIAFDPTGVHGRSATVTVTPSVGNPVDIPLSGTGIQTELTRTPGSLPFGNKDIDDGATVAQDVTVSNSGTEPITLNGIGVGGTDFAVVSGAGTNCTSSTTLNEGDSCKVWVQFDPGSAGAKSDTLTISSNALPSLTVSLSGMGTQTELSRSPTSLSFGSKDINDGATASQTSTVTNSGTEDVTISSVDVPAHFTRDTDQGTDCTATMVLHAGNTCELRIAFDPSSTGAKSGSVTVHSNAADVSVAVDGTGIQTELTLSPTSQAFGNRDIDDGASGSMGSTVTNTGTQPVTLTGINPTGDSGDFPRQTGASECATSQTLNAGESCTLTYRFDPSTVGSKSATVAVTSNAATVNLTLTGQGIQTELSRSPTSLAFGGQDVDSGAAATQTSVVTNSGTEQVSLSSVSLGGTDPTQFVRLTDQPTTDCSSSTVLNAGQTCDVRVQFDPSTKGDKTATITVASNAPSITIDLTGTGKETRLSRSPTSLSFGSKDIDDGATAEQFSTITNIGSEDVTLGAVGIVGADAGHFTRQTGNGNDCAVGTTLQANETCKVRVVFNPSTVGSKSATARVSANGVDQDVALSGTGIQTELSRSPASLSFGSKDIDDAATASQTSVVSNSGSEDVTFTAIALPEHFTHVTGQASDCSTTQLLHAGDTCNVRIAFDPSTVGAKSGSVTVHSNAADVSVAVDGTGTQTELTPDTASLSFGQKDIDEGATAAQTATITNTGTEPISLSGVNQTGSTDFTRATGGSNCSSTTTLTAGQSCTVSATFDPATTGAKTGSITLSSSQVPDIVISLGGSGIQTELSRAPASLAFGSKGVSDGASGAKTSVVTNSGTQDVTLTGIDVTGDFTLAPAATGDCANGTVLHAGDPCNLRIRFDPASTGPKTGTATVHSNAADTSVDLSGTGIATDLSPSPDTLAFGKRDIDDGPTTALQTTITNAGPDAVTVGTIGITGPNAGEFERLVNFTGECLEDHVLAPGATCTLRVRFDPGGTGARTATLNVPAANGGATATVALTGTGTQTGIARDVSSISAGSQDIDDGPTTPQAATVTNTGTEDVTITSVDVTGEFGQAAPQAGDCGSGTVLHGGATCSLRVQFDPSSVGAKTGTATAHTSAGDVSVALDGTGIQTALSHDPSAVDFGSQDVGSSSAVRESAITNTGTQPVTLTDIRLADPGTARFLRVSGLATDCAVGATLAAGDTCKLRAGFVPQSAGPKSATMTLTSSAGVATLALSGNGKALLRIPSFSAKASSTKKRRLTVNVTPVGGTLRNIVVQVKQNGTVLGTGRLTSARNRRGVVVQLKSPLGRGSYRATARGRDAFGNVVTARPRDFRLR